MQWDEPLVRDVLRSWAGQARPVCLITPPSAFLLDERVFVRLGILKVASSLEAQNYRVNFLDLSGVENFLAQLEDYLTVCQDGGRHHHDNPATAFRQAGILPTTIAASSSRKRRTEGQGADVMRSSRRIREHDHGYPRLADPPRGGRFRLHRHHHLSGHAVLRSGGAARRAWPTCGPTRIPRPATGCTRARSITRCARTTTKAIRTAAIARSCSPTISAPRNLWSSAIWSSATCAQALNIPFNPGAPALRYEHSMGQGLPDFIHRIGMKRPAAEVAPAVADPVRAAAASTDAESPGRQLPILMLASLIILPEFRDLRVLKRGEIRGTRADRDQPLLRHALGHARRLHRFGDGAVERGHDLLRHAGRSPQPVPRADLEILEAGFLERRHVGQRAHPLSWWRPQPAAPCRRGTARSGSAPG